MKKLILFVIAIIASLTINAQIAVNNDGSTPDASAMLDVRSSDKGVLIPRMTQSEIASITSPANGLMLFNIDDNHFYFYDDIDEEWKEIAIGAGTITPTPSWTCGDALIDSRDGKSYNTVQIGTQCWMAENLNIGTRINSSVNQTQNTPTEIIEKYCYSNQETNCSIYGGLYQWDEMMQYITIEGAQGICHDGWHLPTNTEWNALSDYLGGYYDAGGKMKEVGTTHWTSPNTAATNSSGFNGLPGGGTGQWGTFSNIGNYGFWYSSTLSGSPYHRYLSFNISQLISGSSYTYVGRSVRCLKD